MLDRVENTENMRSIQKTKTSKSRTQGKSLIFLLELARREEDLRRLNERRSIDFDRRRQMMPMHPQGDMMYPSSASMPNNPYPMAPAYHEAMPPAYSFMPGGPNAGAPMPPPPPPPPPMVEANYTTHQMARAYNHHMGHEYNNQPAQMFDRKRRRN